MPRRSPQSARRSRKRRIPAGLAPLPDAGTPAYFRIALVADEPFSVALRDLQLELDPSQLTLFARWVPRFHAVRRFDTMFFLARCPDGDWEPRVIEGECSGASWLTAADVLDRDRRGEARLIFPTRRTLERLARHRSSSRSDADALAYPIEAVTPWVEERGGEQFITIPGHLGYPVTQEKLDGLWRG